MAYNIMMDLKVFTLFSIIKYNSSTWMLEINKYRH